MRWINRRSEGMNSRFRDPSRFSKTENRCEITNQIDCCLNNDKNLENC